MEFLHLAFEGFSAGIGFGVAMILLSLVRGNRPLI